MTEQKDYKFILINQLEQAQDIMDNLGENSYVNTGLYIAIRIIEAGTDIDVEQFICKDLNFGYKYCL